MKVLVEQQYKESHVIDQLNKLGFHATEGLSYRELKKTLAIERAKRIEVSNSNNAWF